MGRKFIGYPNGSAEHLGLSMHKAARQDFFFYCFFTMTFAGFLPTTSSTQ